MLVAASFISLFLKEYPEAIAIFVVVVLNILFTLFQVYKADNAVAALKALISNKTIVIRNGQNQEIESSELVPGDVIYLESGNKVPADIKILEATYTEVNESILTGESVSVQKTLSDGKEGVIFMGTSIVIGQIYGEVINIGLNTEFGKIAKTMRSVEEKETNLQKKLKELTKLLGILGVLGALIVFGLSFLQDKTLFESFLLTISLAVAVVPEGLPAVMTAILSIGVGQMAKEGVIIRRLDAIEGFGDITVLATDKTGTLTQNKMKVEKLWVRETNLKNFSKEEALQMCFTLNVSVTDIPNIDGTKNYIGDPTEIALREYIDEEFSVDTDYNNIKVIKEIPFSSETRIKKTYIQKDDKNTILINGAPETVLQLDRHLSNSEKKEIELELQKNASLGFRTIAYAIGENDDNIHFVGFASLRDPLRPGIKGPIEEAAHMGIRTILITGDNPLTATAIAIEAGITNKKSSYITGDMLNEMSDEKLMSVIDEVEVFARIAPDQKLRLIKILQKKGEFVAMTGDGVNDAPALKQADIGVAMGKVGTDVAKEAADAVVTDDNYVTMVTGIRAGRAIIRRIELATTFFIAGNIGEFTYVLFALLFGLPTISPLQLLFINLITDAIPALALSFAPVKAASGKKTTNDKSLLGKAEYEFITITAIIVTVSTIFATWFYKDDPSTAKSIAFLMIIVLQQMMLIDIWLGMIKHAIDIKKLLNKSILAALATTGIILLVVYNTEIFDKLFDMKPIPKTAFVSFIYAAGAYVVYVLTRIHSKR